MKRLFSAILVLCTILSSVILFRTNSSALDGEEPINPTEHQGVVSLDGKKIMVVGNSMVYYGNCVIYGDQGEKDQGYLYQLIKQNGENATVIDHTYSGKKLEYIFDNYISKLSEKELDVDYLVLSEGNQDNYDLLGTVQKYLEIFPDDVEFRFLRQPMMFEKDEKFFKPHLIEGVEKLREAGYFVVDWGKLVYDIYSGETKVPGATMEFKRTSFMKENLGFDNADGTVHGSGNNGDKNHENPLSGYVTAQMLYSSLSNRAAYLTDYEFCYDTSVHENFNIDNFAKTHYTDPANPTNFHKIFRSPQDMLGLQQVMDEYLAKEGLHPLTVQPEVKPTCISGGLTLGSYCKICQKVVDEQKFVEGGNFAEHTLVTTNGKAPTCTKPGKTIGVSCSTCGEQIIEAESIAPTHHYIYSQIYKASTATEGKIKQVCLYCNEEFNTESIKKVTTLKLSETLYTYDGTEKTPTLIVVDANNKNLVENKDYVVTYPSGRTEIGDHKVTVAFKGNYKSTKELTFKIRPNAVKKFKAEAKSTSVTLTWVGTTNATHYRIYKYNSATKTYTKVADTDKTTYKVKGLTRGTKYKFRIRPLTRSGNTDYFSAKYKYVTTITTPATAKISKIFSSKSKIAKLNWKAVTNAEGYEITYSTSKTFKKAKTATISKKDATTATIKKLSKGKKYYFKVRAYRKLSGKKIYGSYSKVKSKTIKS